MENVSLGACLDLQHILEPEESGSDQLEDQKPAVQEEGVGDCLDVKIKINFDR